MPISRKQIQLGLYINMQWSVADRTGGLGSSVVPSCRKVITIIACLFQVAQFYPTGP